MTTPTLSKKVAALLLERGMTQSVLAELARTNRGHLSRILRGKRPWTVPILEQVARALDLDPSELAEGTPEAALLQPNGATVEREYVEKIAGELAAAVARIQSLEAERAELKARNATLEENFVGARVEADQLRRERDAAVADAKRVNDEAKRQAVAMAKTQAELAELRATVAQGRKQLDDLMKALAKSNHQLMVNYDAYKQAEARANDLAARLQQEGKKAAATALFAGLIGLGVGAAAASDS